MTAGRDLVASTEAALDYFAYLNDYFDGDWLLTIAAYNAGEGTVKRAIERNASRGQPTDFWHLDLPAQTEAYVPRLLAVRDLIAEPEAHGITLPEIPNERAIRTVELEGQIDLSLAAELAGISTDALYRLNPGYNRWATPPEGPDRLVVPAQRAERFRQGLAARAPSERMRWQRHEVARGDTLGEIADRYHTSVAMLRDLNDLNGNLIRVGDELVVPASGRPVQGQRLAGRGGGGERALQHEVQPGDSLWAVARRYDVTVDQLVAWNQLSPDTVLQPGDTLRIRQGGEAGGAGQSVYTVRKGDSLYRIAREFDVRVADLRRWNGIDRGDYLRPGQQLQVQAR
ncbi:MAG: LysM peptidoglycan-binding domain-containing protein [Arhodomonas sp.]|nr:LysM peptidoglycan-binding domain-containing protein [Arhodomonas sp.]